MLGLKTRTDWKYLKIEIFFFIFICYLGAIISDMEYSFYEEHRLLNFISALEARLVWGTFFFIFYGAYYWLFLKKYVFKRKTMAIVVSIAAFIILSHLYNKYVMNWFIIKFTFLSEEFRGRALKDFNRPHLYYIISYTLERIVFTIIGFAFLIRSLQQDEQLKSLKEQQLITELNYLKAQLQPHFFFNTLNNIYGLAIKNDKSTAPMLAKLADLMRYIIYEADQQTVPLVKDIEFLTNYVAIEKMRHHEHVSINFEVQGSMEGHAIQPLLLLPFIENAFKHGLQDETQKGNVEIIICKMEKELTLEVSNSRPTAKLKGSFVGMGIANVKKRLALLYPGQHELQIVDNVSSHHVNLTLLLR
ncbi:MAG: histidine kinase [Pedobacter sp.]|nr:histidine kinase [Pedobacter sp.]MDQ8053540.1 histidine kinase [Pedobacter sp.]